MVHVEYVYNTHNFLWLNYQGIKKVGSFWKSASITETDPLNFEAKSKWSRKENALDKQTAKMY